MGWTIFVFCFDEMIYRQLPNVSYTTDSCDPETYLSVGYSCDPETL